MDPPGGDRWRLPEEVRRTVLSAVRPSDDEVLRTEEASRSLVREVGTAAKRLGIEGGKAILSGSVAKGTYMSGPDLDVFILFPVGTPLEVVRSEGLKVGKMVLDEPVMNYAQHPYITGRFKGIRADVVPGIDIPVGGRIVTAVDRTQHHTAYVNARMTAGLRDDVLLFKAFLKGIGSYGAEDTANGFSGYLAELIVLWKGGFDGAILWFASLETSRTPPGRSEEIGVPHMGPSIGPVAFRDEPLKGVDPLSDKDYRRMFKDDAMIIVDPVDPERNVASPVSGQTLANTCSACADLISNPRAEVFSPNSRRPHDGTGGIPDLGPRHLRFDLPDGNPSRVMSQVRSGLTKLSRALLRSGFDRVLVEFLLAFPPGADIDGAYLKSRVVWNADIDRPSVLFALETVPGSLSSAYMHPGPPVGHRLGPDFMRRWEGKEVLETDGRYCIMLERRTTDPYLIAMDLWSGIGHGPDLSGSSLEDVLTGPAMGPGEG